MFYPSDVTDMPPKRIKGYFEYENYRNRSKHEKTELINAVFYLTRTGCQWRQLPIIFHLENSGCSEYTCTVAGCKVFEKPVQKYPSLLGVCADTGYRKTIKIFVIHALKKTIKISKRIVKQRSFLPKNGG